MSNLYNSLEHKVFRIILKEVKAKKNILDIGCGSCSMACPFKAIKMI